MRADYGWLAGVLIYVASGSWLFASPITTGNILMPDAGAGIQELAAGTLAKVQTISLPAGYSFAAGGNTPATVLVSGDHHIFVNVIDAGAGSKPALLTLDSSGAFVSVLHPELPLASFLDQLVFDPADPTKTTVLGGVNDSGNVDAMHPFTPAISTKISTVGATVHGMALDTSGNIYVGDASSGVIKKYSSSGTFIADFTTVLHSSTHAQEGMTLDAGGNLYVTQATSSSVLKYDSTGTFVTAFTGFHIFDPWGVYFDPIDGFLYVGNSGGSAVVTILKTDGTFVADDFSSFKLTGSFVGEATIVPPLTGPVVPEPSTWWMLGSGLGALVGLSRRLIDGHP
jgi:DNA-binding beta-propeller fold protein YncE